jgi:hypothetical protein
MEIINTSNTDNKLEKEYSSNYEEENLILEHITIVTNGIIKDIEVNNSFASWKNTPKGLTFIKNKTKDFYLGVSIWLTLTENQFLKTQDINILKTMTSTFPWLKSFILLKELMSKVNEA